MAQQFFANFSNTKLHESPSSNSQELSKSKVTIPEIATARFVKMLENLKS
jgi:hypothetical protein